MDSDDVAGSFMVLLVLVLLFGGFILFMVNHKDNVDKECKSTYGQTWVGKTPLYSPDFCVNNDGSVKYLQ